MEVETMLRGKYDGKKMRKEFKTLHDDTDLCKMHQWLITSVSLYSASTNWKLSLWWFAFVYDWKDLASCFPLQWTSSSQRSGSKSPSHSGLVPLFIHRHWHMQQVLHWLELLVSPQKAICWFTLNSAQGLSVITTLCSSTPARIICDGKSNTKEWSGKDCVSWKQEPAVKVSV